MVDHTARIQAWLVDLAAIIAEIEAGKMPTPRPTTKRTRKLKPLWEE